VADLIRVRTNLQITTGNPLLSTMYFDTSATNSTDAADAVEVFWQAAETVMSSECTWAIERECAIVNPVNGEITSIEDSGSDRAGSGDLTDQLLPPATQGLVQWHTGAVVAGRRVAGKTFIPGLTEDGSSAGIPSTAVLASLSDAAAAIQAATPAGFVIFSRKHGAGYAVTSGTVWTEFAVLRSRRD